MASSGSFNTSGYGPGGDWYRCLNFSWSIQSQSIANNTTTISWELRGAGGATNNWYVAGPISVTIDGVNRYYSDARINLMNGTLVASGTVTMAHNSSGEKSFGASVEGAIYTYAVNVSGSATWTLTPIPRKATLTSAPNFTDIQNPTIGYTNAAGNSVTSLQACIANTAGSVIYAPYRNISKTGSSYTFQLTEQERQTLRSATVNSPTLALKFYVKTVIGGNTFYDTLDRTMTIVDGNPTFYMNYKDTNATVVAITNNNQQIVRNQSTLQVNITDAVAVKYATLASATCVVNGTSYSGTFSGDSCTFNIGTINVSSNTTATLTVTDSRGLSTTKNLAITVLDWVLPTAIITKQRENNFYSNTSINVDGIYSSVDGKNAMTIKLRYKKTTNTTWSTYTTMQDNVPQTFNLDNNYAWDIQVVVSDLFGSTTYNDIVDRGMPIIYFDRALSSVGFNRFPTHANSVEGVQPIVLYDNSTGSDSTITLNETAANFSYLEIFYKNNDNEFSSVKVADPNGKTITLMNVHANASSVAYFKSTTVQISGTSISPVSYSELGISASGTTFNNVNHNFITKVVGVV